MLARRVETTWENWLPLTHGRAWAMVWSTAMPLVEGRQILNHPDLEDYDPRLFAALAKAYGDNHRLRSDPFWMSAARVPPGPPPRNTAEEC